MSEPHLVALRLVLAPDRDQLLDDLERPLLALELVVLVLDALDEQVLHVRHHVGEGERDVVVLAERDARQAGDRRSAAPAPFELEADLVPDPRHAARQVGIAGEKGAPGGGAAWTHSPVVGAACRRREADLVADAPDLLREPKTVAVEALAGPEHDGIALRIAGVDLRGALLAELADQVGSEQLPLPVRG